MTDKRIIKCFHLEDIGREFDPDGASIDLSEFGPPYRILVIRLCGLCAGNVQLHFVKSFVQSVFPKPPIQYGRFR